MFELKETGIHGCFHIIFRKLSDKRGDFIKTFHKELFQQLNITMELREEYFTTSQKNVFRGLHFQVPPKALDKLVYCVAGQVTDYIVDIRKNSPTFGKHIAFELDGNVPSAVFAPVGLAHGFYVKSEQAVMQYKVSETYDAAADAGISYRSFSFAGDFKDPVISERDESFPLLKEYDSPFVYKP